MKAGREKRGRERESRSRVLTISQGFEDDTHKFGGAEAYHGGDEFLVEGEEGEGELPTALTRPLYQYVGIWMGV